jgi:GGDEF domain-containing protein
MRPERILVAFQDPSTRDRIRALLAGEQNMTVVADADSGLETLARAVEHEVRTIVGDVAVVGDPAVEAEVASYVDRVGCKVILATTSTADEMYSGSIPITATLPLDLPDKALGVLMRFALRSAVSAGRTKPVMSATSTRARDLWPQLDGTLADRRAGSRAAAPRRRSSAANGGPAPEPSLSRGDTRRPVEAEMAELKGMLRSLQEDAVHERDPLTGLPDNRALELVLSAVPAVNQPAAVVVLDVWSPLGAVGNLDAQKALLHSVGSALRVNVRRDDLVCYVKDMMFAVVLPGVEPLTAARPLHRLRLAMEYVRQPAHQRVQRLSMAVGVGFWHPNTPSTDPFEQGWRAMVAERDAVGYSVPSGRGSRPNPLA